MDVLILEEDAGLAFGECIFSVECKMAPFKCLSDT